MICVETLHGHAWLQTQGAIPHLLLCMQQDGQRFQLFCRPNRAEKLTQQPFWSSPLDARWKARPFGFFLVFPTDAQIIWWAGCTRTLLDQLYEDEWN